MSSHESTPQLWTNTVRPRHTVNIITSMSLTGANQESGHEIVKSHMGLVLTSRSVAPEPKSLKKTSLELVSRLIFSALFFLFFYLTFINIFHQICPELKLSPCDLEVFIPQVHLFLSQVTFNKKTLLFSLLACGVQSTWSSPCGLKVRQQVWRCSPDTISVLFI